MDLLSSPSKSARAALVWAGALGFTAVAAAAFGAHGVTDPKVRSLLQTGGEYGMIHAVAAMAAMIINRFGLKPARYASWCFLIGGSLFSASLYGLAFSGQFWLGVLTPVGGLFMLAGWATIAWAGFKA